MDSDTAQCIKDLAAALRTSSASVKELAKSVETLYEFDLALKERVGRLERDVKILREKVKQL